MKRVLILLFLLSNICLNAQEPESFFKFINGAGQQVGEEGAKAFNIGSWNINYDESYVTLRDVKFIGQEEGSQGPPEMTVSLGKAIGDYLYFDHQDDIAYYALRVEELAVVMNELGVEKEDEESKIKLDRIALPFGNVLHEFYAPRIEVLMANLTGEGELRVPIVLEDVLVEKMEILPTKIDTNLYGRLSAKGKVFDGTLDVKGRVNPFYDPMILDMNLKVENISLTELNPFMKEFGNIEAIKGKISVFIESAVVGDKVVGYVRFETKDAEMTKGWDTDESFWRNIKENVADMFFRLFNRGEKNRVVGKVSFEGPIDDVEYDFWQLFRTLIRHAVVSPMDGKIEESINLKTVEESAGGELAE